ncbi:Histidine kinase [Sulfidibacter corallicola]|uniref:Chemotaxis protein CheA n=1 Tax=Sulfidibacter corallicola TaxID=2818388 RepID=A0A8A4TQW0_SULCO|nr:chemotaxis protein CheA [Sulfidibacter corallicola]QTD51574.1 chemotaxis protein CheA [Sulfidibacter corallicola]
MNDTEILTEFLAESADILSDLNTQLLDFGDLLDSGSHHESINTIHGLFRGFHSLKGSAVYLHFEQMAAMTHEAEYLLDLLRKGKLETQDSHIGILLETVHALEILMEDIQTKGEESSNRNDHEALLLKLRHSHSAPQPQSGLNGTASHSWNAPDNPVPCRDVNQRGFSSTEGVPLQDPPVQRPKSRNREPSKLGSILVEQGKIAPEDLEAALEQQYRPLGKTLIDMGAISQEDLQAGLEQQAKPSPTTKNVVASQPHQVKVRVSLEKIGQLGNLVGELAIAENAMVNHPLMAKRTNEPLRNSAVRLSNLIRDLHAATSQLRSIPIETAFEKIKTIARETARKLDKKIAIHMEGKDIELDRIILEKLHTPLVHLVRNSLDHGIETPRQRIAAGKNEIGTLLCAARLEGNEAVIQIRDDGAGMDPEKILAKARQKGILPDPPPQSREEKLNLIFEPGFSTRDDVTDISGRGVGMDVVRQEIQALDGKIEISSAQGVFSEFSIRIPLSLSVIEGMLTALGDHQMIVPLTAVREILTTPSTHRDIDGSLYLHRRGSLVPILDIRNLFHFQEEVTGKGVYIIIETERGTAAIHIDKILGLQNTVIRKPCTYLGTLHGITGFSIQSDGAIAMVLNPTELVDSCLS